MSSGVGGNPGDIPHVQGTTTLDRKACIAVQEERRPRLRSLIVAIELVSVFSDHEALAIADIAVDRRAS